MTGHQEAIMVAAEKRELPLEAQPASLHYRLTAVEDSQKQILATVQRNHRILKRSIRKGFETCSASRPCAKPAQGIDWSAMLPTLQKALIGLAALGTLIGAALLGPSQKADQPQVTISQPALPSPGGK